MMMMMSTFCHKANQSKDSKKKSENKNNGMHNVICGEKKGWRNSYLHRNRPKHICHQNKTKQNEKYGENTHCALTIRY